MIEQTLTIAELADLNRLEKIIDENKPAWVRIGNALSIIRDRRLYRRAYSSFEDYLQNKWGWTRQWAHQQIEAASVAESLPKKVSSMLDSVRSATELSKVEPERRVEVLKEASSSGVATARSISVASKIVKSESKDAVMVDATGFPIPEPLLIYWNRADEVQEILTQLSHIKGTLEKAMEEKDLMYWELGTGPVAHLSRAWQEIHAAKPYAVCLQCQGHPEIQPEGKCRLCGGRGLISKHRWETVPEEMRTLRIKVVRGLQK